MKLLSRSTRRRWTDRGARLLTLACAGLAVLPLLLVLWYVASQGLRAVNLTLFTGLPKPPGEPGGGMKNAILGTGELVLLASALGLPIGVLTGIYLAEFKETRFGTLVRFTADVLNGIPSIVIGVFVYVLVVVPMRSFSALAGGIALGVMMIPLISRTTEELLRLVPVSLREASFGLGASQWQTITRTVLPAARSGIVTGVMLAVARVAGETAPLLFTALNTRFVSFSLRQPIASLTVQIYNYASGPYDDWHQQAWAAALLLVSLILALSLATRWFTRGQARSG